MLAGVKGNNNCVYFYYLWPATVYWRIFYFVFVCGPMCRKKVEHHCYDRALGYRDYYVPRIKRTDTKLLTDVKQQNATWSDSFCYSIIDFLWQKI